MKNKEENTERTKFKFGRNPLSFLIVLAGLGIILFVVSTIYSYTSTWKKYNITPFVTVLGENPTDKEKERLDSNLPSNFELKEADKNNTVTRMDGKDFNVFDLSVECLDFGQTTTYNAKFRTKIKWNDNTSKKASVLRPFDDTNKNVKIAYCLGADWVGFCKYSSSVLSLEVKSDREEKQFSDSYVEGTNFFPKTAKTFPGNIKVKTPNLYVFLHFQYENDGLKTETYILRYTFNEYHTENTIGYVG